MICPGFPPPQFFLYTDQIPPLIYYSHFSVLIALIIGIFVNIKNKSIVSRVLFYMSLTFLVWTIFDLITWTNNNSDIIMFAWSLLPMIYSTLIILCLYLFYVFIKRQDISLNKKIIFFIILLPVFLFTPTSYNLKGFDLIVCGAAGFEGSFVIYYKLILGVSIFLWILLLTFRRYMTADPKSKKPLILFALGIEFFILSLFTSEFIASYLVDNKIMNDFSFTQYGFFAMSFFMGMLAYLIVRFQAFNVKLLAAQALVISIIILIGSQFFFIRTFTNQILTGITLLLSSIGGYILVRSVKKEVQQREELAKLNIDLQTANKKISSDKKIVEKANEQLIKLDKAKSEFIDIASHQLRTPISVISGVASMMLEGDIDKMPPEQKQKFYQSVWEKTKKLKVIVHDILNATSFTNRKFNVMDQLAEQIDVAELLKKIIKDFEIEVKERDIDLTISSMENIPKIRGQKEYLEESFINLINNAIKYTPSSKMTADVRGKREGDGRGKVAVSVKRYPGNSKNIIIEVKDNGIGIPAEDKPKLFNRFSRAKNAVDMYTDGTGLGLFIAKEIIEGHGGKIWFESELNQGAAFFVSLPINSDKKVDIKEHIMKEAISNPTN